MSHLFNSLVAEDDEVNEEEEEAEDEKKPIPSEHEVDSEILNQVKQLLQNRLVKSAKLVIPKAQPVPPGYIRKVPHRIIRSTTKDPTDNLYLKCKNCDGFTSHKIVQDYTVRRTGNKRQILECEVCSNQRTRQDPAVPKPERVQIIVDDDKYDTLIKFARKLGLEELIKSKPIEIPTTTTIEQLEQ